MIVAEIGREAAMPFIAAYCSKWGLPLQQDGAAFATWFGAFHRGGLRGVLGLTSIRGLDNSLFVHGLYSEDSKFGKLAVSRMIKLLDRLKQRLYCAIHLPNMAMFKVAGNHGFKIETVDLIHSAAFLYREARS